jgi:Glycosyl hydrolase family 12
VRELSASDGTTASFSVSLNADKGTTEVVGYPSDQCLIYSALPGTLTSAYQVTPPASSAGLDYEYAYDIWLTTSSAATNFDWNNDLELMIWTDVNGQVPAGSKVDTLSDGSAVWFAGTIGDNNSTVSVVLPSNSTTGTVDIASIVAQLKSRGYVPSSDNGILDVEYGIEAPYGGGNTFTVNALSVSR